MIKVLSVIVASIVWVLGVFGQKDSVNVTVDVAELSSPSPDLISSPTPIASPVMKATPYATPTPVANNSSSSDWQYPNSTFAGSGKWQSSDSPSQITNWYKDKIKMLGFNSTSFVQTNTNDNVLNKLAAAKNSSKVAVEISKSPSQTLTSVSVVLDN